ncbi:hypothetical protein NQZ79_g5402 [Umbelopsis isabellina]|nr:hypothetical protein NQZ79_g5402 [Umbelopsis isabellina]
MDALLAVPMFADIDLDQEPATKSSHNPHSLPSPPISDAGFSEDGLQQVPDAFLPPVENMSISEDQNSIENSEKKVSSFEFDDLPKELRIKTFQNLAVKDLMQAAMVCRAWKQLTLDGSLWSNIDVTPYYRNITTEQLLALGVAAGGFLKIANFRGCIQLTGHSLRTLAECCPNVKVLQLKDCRTVSTPSIACFISQAHQLQVLDVSGLDSIKNHTLQAVASSCPLLRILNVAWCRNINGDGINAIAQGCKLLEHLKMNGCPRLDDATMSTIGENLPNLKRLCLASCSDLKDRALLAFLDSSHGRLTHLNISNCAKITDTVMYIIADKFTVLTHLEMAGCSLLTDDGLTHLVSHLNGIVNLDLEDLFQITDTSIREIAHHQRNLRRLCVSGCVQITDSVIIHLVLRGSCTDSLEQLELDNCSAITDRALTTIATHLATRKAIFSQSSTSDSSSSFFSTSPPRLNKLSSFATNSSEDSFDKALGRKKRQLSVEVLDCNNITENGVRTALDQAAPLLQIKSFYSWNDNRRRSLADAEDNSTTTTVDLTGLRTNVRRMRYYPLTRTRRRRIQREANTVATGRSQGSSCTIS